MVEAADVLIEGTVVTMDDDCRIICDGAVVVVGDRIAAIGKAEEMRQAFRAQKVLGGAHRFVVPGLIDCHNHLGQTFVREFGVEDLPSIYRICIPCEIAMTGEEAKISAQAMIWQLLRAGVTTVAETTCTRAHEDPIASAVMETGIRCAMARGQGDRTSRLAGNYEQVEGKSWYEDDAGRLADDLIETEDFIKRWQAKGEGRLRPWIHTMALPACSDERFQRTKELADRYGTGMMTHINRDREEVELSMALFGERPLEHLHRLGALGPNFLAIHAMLATDREIRLLAETDSKVAHAPFACIDVWSAVTKIVTMRSAGVTVGLGCDTIVNDLWRVASLAALMHSQAVGLPQYDPISLTTEDAFTMATIDGARALLWDKDIGSLEVGKLADIAVVDGENLRLSPTHSPINALVRYAVGTDVESVLVGGRIVVSDGEVLTVDGQAVLKEAAQVSAKLAGVLEPRRYRPLTSRAVIQ